MLVDKAADDHFGSWHVFLPFYKARSMPTSIFLRMQNPRKGSVFVQNSELKMRIIQIIQRHFALFYDDIAGCKDMKRTTWRNIARREC